MSHACSQRGTFFVRHALEVHISWEGGIELIDVIDLVDKSAAGDLAAILKCLDRLQTLQRGMGLPPTPLWAFRTLYADNASVNTGSIGGLLARMVLIAAQFIGNRSQYVANVIEDSTLMEECMTRVSTRLASKEVRYMTYCRLRLEHLLEENGRKLATAKSKERDGKILARLLNASLVPKDTSSMTADVLKGAMCV